MSQSQPIHTDTLEAVCGSSTVGVTGERIHCTYPPSHGPLVDADGQGWDHGVFKAGTAWKTDDEENPS